ncbi:MAG: hypothetical protein LUH03_08720 [Oscillospiraceae bacterium]|nr:hypothetical protein [Oscillospiraceae bacterium]
MENAIERSVYEIIKENAILAIPQMAERLSVNGRTVQRAINLLKEKALSFAMAENVTGIGKSSEMSRMNKKK